MHSLVPDIVNKSDLVGLLDQDPVKLHVGRIDCSIPMSFIKITNNYNK